MDLRPHKTKIFCVIADGLGDIDSDGALMGGASLEAEDFLALIQLAASAGSH